MTLYHFSAHAPTAAAVAAGALYQSYVVYLNGQTSVGCLAGVKRRFTICSVEGLQLTCIGGGGGMRSEGSDRGGYHRRVIWENEAFATTW